MADEYRYNSSGELASYIDKFIYFSSKIYNLEKEKVAKIMSVYFKKHLSFDALSSNFEQDSKFDYNRQFIIFLCMDRVIYLHALHQLMNEKHDMNSQIIEKFIVMQKNSPNFNNVINSDKQKLQLWLHSITERRIVIESLIVHLASDEKFQNKYDFFKLYPILNKKCRQCDENLSLPCIILILLTDLVLSIYLIRFMFSKNNNDVQVFRENVNLEENSYDSLFFWLLNPDGSLPPHLFFSNLGKIITNSWNYKISLTNKTKLDQSIRILVFELIETMFANDIQGLPTQIFMDIFSNCSIDFSQYKFIHQFINKTASLVPACTDYLRLVRTNRKFSVCSFLYEKECGLSVTKTEKGNYIKKTDNVTNAIFDQMCHIANGTVGLYYSDFDPDFDLVVWKQSFSAVEIGLSIINIFKDFSPDVFSQHIISSLCSVLQMLLNNPPFSEDFDIPSLSANLLDYALLTIPEFLNSLDPILEYEPIYSCMLKIYSHSLPKRMRIVKYGFHQGFLAQFEKMRKIIEYSAVELNHHDFMFAFFNLLKKYYMSGVEESKSWWVNMFMFLIYDICILSGSYPDCREVYSYIDLVCEFLDFTHNMICNDDFKEIICQVLSMTYYSCEFYCPVTSLYDFLDIDESILFVNCFCHSPLILLFNEMLRLMVRCFTDSDSPLNIDNNRAVTLYSCTIPELILVTDNINQSVIGVYFDAMILLGKVVPKGTFLKRDISSLFSRCFGILENLTNPKVAESLLNFWASICSNSPSYFQNLQQCNDRSISNCVNLIFEAHNHNEGNIYLLHSVVRLYQIMVDHGFENSVTADVHFWPIIMIKVTTILKGEVCFDDLILTADLFFLITSLSSLSFPECPRVDSLYVLLNSSLCHIRESDDLVNYQYFFTVSEQLVQTLQVPSSENYETLLKMVIHLLGSVLNDNLTVIADLANLSHTLASFIGRREISVNVDSVIACLTIMTKIFESLSYTKIIALDYVMISLLSCFLSLSRIGEIENFNFSPVIYVCMTLMENLSTLEQKMNLDLHFILDLSLLVLGYCVNDDSSSLLVERRTFDYIKDIIISHSLFSLHWSSLLIFLGNCLKYNKVSSILLQSCVFDAIPLYFMNEQWNKMAEILLTFVDNCGIRAIPVLVQFVLATEDEFMTIIDESLRICSNDNKVLTHSHKLAFNIFLELAKNSTFWRQNANLTGNYHRILQFLVDKVIVFASSLYSSMPQALYKRFHDTNIVALYPVINYLPNVSSFNSLIEAGSLLLHILSLLSSISVTNGVMCSVDSVVISENFALNWQFRDSLLSIIQYCHKIRKLIVEGLLDQEEDYSDFVGLLGDNLMLLMEKSLSLMFLEIMSANNIGQECVCHTVLVPLLVKIVQSFRWKNFRISEERKLTEKAVECLFSTRDHQFLYFILVELQETFHDSFSPFLH